MIDKGKYSVAGVLVDAVDYEAAVAKVMSAARAGQPMSVSALAVHGVMTGVQDRAQRFRLNHIDLIVPDGQPVRWALNVLHGAGLNDRVYGPNLMLKLCEQAAAESLPVYLYGSRPEVLAALGEDLRARFPGFVLAGAEGSRFRCLSPEEKQDVIERIRKSGARMTFVGLGCPRQEVWIYEYRDLLQMPVLAVGAAFDFFAGTVRQAPEYLQRAGLEWLFRLAQEPRRLWQRYLFLNPYYSMLVLLQAARLRTYDSAGAVPLTDVSPG